MTHDAAIRLDHVGFAVEDVDSAEPVFDLLGARKYVDDTGPEGQFRWVGYKLGDASGLELIEPLSPDSFLRRFLDEHGPGLHHVTFEVSSLEPVVAVLEAAGMPVVDRSEHDIYAEAFVSPRNPTGALLQLMEFKAGYEDVYGSDYFIRNTRVEVAARQDPHYVDPQGEG
jgi:methylmalonyl-CoA/ethylmalonyl-CoA epimerase